MSKTLKLEIVTPEAKTYSEDVEMVTLPGLEGEMGIYPGHVPLMTEVVCGEVIAKSQGGNEYLAIGNGFVEITGDKVAVLTDMAIKADDIDEEAVEKARRKAEERRGERLSEEDQASIDAVLAQAAAQLEVKRRRRK